MGRLGRPGGGTDQAHESRRLDARRCRQRCSGGTRPAVTASPISRACSTEFSSTQANTRGGSGSSLPVTCAQPGMPCADSTCPSASASASSSTTPSSSPTWPRPPSSASTEVHRPRSGEAPRIEHAYLRGAISGGAECRPLRRCPWPASPDVDRCPRQRSVSTRWRVRSGGQRRVGSVRRDRGARLLQRRALRSGR